MFRMNLLTLHGCSCSFVAVFICSLILDSLPCRLSIQKAQQPQRDAVVLSHLGVVSGVDGIGAIMCLMFALRVADSELPPAVYHVEAVFAGVVHRMVFPHAVYEEGLHQVLCFRLVRIDDVLQVGVVHHHFGGFLREILAYGIDDVYQPGVGQVFDVIHHRGAAGLYLMRQIADVGRTLSFSGQQIEQFLDFGEVLQLDLLDQQDVNLRHHVHGLQQILREIAILQEKRVEAMVYVVHEVFRGTGLWQDLLDDVFVAREYLVKRVWRELVVGLEVEKLAEREPPQVVTLHDAVQFGILFLEPHHARAGEDYLQLREAVVASS